MLLDVDDLLSSSFSFSFSLSGGVTVSHLHITLSSACSSLTTVISSFSPSINLLFGIPLGLLSGSFSLGILLQMYSISILFTCSNHLSLASLVLSGKGQMHFLCTSGEQPDV
ncbi:hypothetical protein GOODEAATRI_032551 [Goodea atripinnis]|uniref:Uncharacterized protein n=1 Tax=Goodea atripinnis TaxID=208336 RepID=A0ABV0Q3P4_9TELE